MDTMEQLSEEAAEREQGQHGSVAGSYLTFSHGDALYALSVNNVVYISSSDALTSCTVPSVERESQRVFLFQDQNVPLYSFCSLMNTQSLREEITELLDLLAQRRQDHINWMDALENSIRSGEPFTKATDPHQCAFGVWYDQYRPADEQLQTILAKFDEPHKRIHSLAEKLLLMAKSGEQHQAIVILQNEKRSTLTALLDLFAQASSRLEEMFKPVVVILQTDSRLFAIEVESIDDILDFDEEHWLLDPEVDHNSHCYDGFFQRPDGSLFVKLNVENLLD